MKKLYVIAAVMLSMIGTVGYVRAVSEVVTAPSSPNSWPLNADYGGVDVFVASFTFAQNVSSGVTNRNVSFQADKSSITFQNGLSLVYGVTFSSGNCNDKVDLFESTGSFVDAKYKGSLFNVAQSTTGSQNGSAVCAGFMGWQYPVRFYGNVFYRANSNAYNSIMLHYWREQ